MNEDCMNKDAARNESILELTSRIDERIKIIIENNITIVSRLDKITEVIPSLSERITALEAQNVASLKQEIQNTVIRKLENYDKKLETQGKEIQDIKARHSNLESGFTHKIGIISNILDYIAKIGMVILTGFLMYKLGLRP